MSTNVTYGDVDYLNFALNLEYLEAEFYLRAATGSGLAAADTGSATTTVTGGAKVPGLSTAQQNILNEIAYDEQQHVRALRSALGSPAVSRPNIDFTKCVQCAGERCGDREQLQSVRELRCVSRWGVRVRGCRGDGV